MKLLPLLCLLSAGFGPASAGETCNSAESDVTVAEGEDALLPCAPVSKPNIVKFDWQKDKDKDKKEVFFYDSQNQKAPFQDEQFRDRVDFFKEELKSGNASIKIRNTRLKDSGTYTCVVFDSQDIQSVLNIRLNVVGVLKKRENVNGAAREPYIKPVRDEITWKLLECKAQGVPQPELEWRNSAGDILKQMEKYEPKNQNGPFHVKLTLNVTRSDTYTCVVKQESICHQINDTMEVSIPDFMPVSEGHDAVLPCHLHSKENIENMNFSWSKDHQEVFLYDRSAVEEGQQFRGRVTYFQHELKFGNAAIKIQKTQMSDSGRYTCHFANHQKSHVILHVVGKEIDLVALCGWIVAVILGLIVIAALIICCLCKKTTKKTGRASDNEIMSLNSTTNPGRI